MKVVSRCPDFTKPYPAPSASRFFANDKSGEEFELEAEGLLATCIQHEIDHLDGKLFVDYISNLKRQRIRQKLGKKNTKSQRDSMSQLRLCFAGTPGFAAEHLSYLIERDFSIAAVYTQPDRPSGRGKKLQPSPVKKVALDAGLLVKQPATLRSDDAADELSALTPDLLIVVAYGLILPQRILDIPKSGCINVHASLLPRWRGAAPIERALLAGDQESGVTIMKMDAGLDTGPILYKQSVSIESCDDRLSLTEKLSRAGQHALVYSLENLDRLLESPEKQDDTEATYAEKVTKDESRIEWNNTARHVLNVIRAGVGRAPAFALLGENRVRYTERSYQS